MPDFWGLWNRTSKLSHETDLANIAQGLFSSEQIDVRAISNEYSVAAAGDSLIGADQRMIRRLPNGGWMIGTARIDNQIALRETLKVRPTGSDSANWSGLSRTGVYTLGRTLY